MLAIPMLSESMHAPFDAQLDVVRVIRDRTTKFDSSGMQIKVTGNSAVITSDSDCD
jgi:hypothetical protein